MDDTSKMEAAVLEIAAILDGAVKDILAHADGAYGFSMAVGTAHPFGQTEGNALIAGALMKASHQLESAALGIGLVSKALRNAKRVTTKDDFINTGIATDSQV